MSLRTAVVAPLMLAAVLTAQETEKPQEPKALTPAQQAKKLEAEKARLQAEIEYARERVENADSLLSSKLTRGKPQFKVIDAGKPKGMVPVQPKRIERKFARVGTPEEMRIGGGDAMVVVNRRGISQQQYDAVYEYLMSYNAQANPDLTAQRVLYDLIRIEGVAGSFVENPGRVKLGEALSKLQDGTMSFADAAQQYGTIAGAGDDGSISITRNSVQGPFFEYMAFSTEQGKVSRPFLTPRGYVVLKVENVQKGAQPALDKVDCKVVQFAFSENDKEMMDAQYQITSAQAEVLVRDETILQKLPALYRPPQARQSPVQMMKQQVSNLEMAIKKLTENGEGESEQADALRGQIEALKNRIKQVQASGADAAEKGGDDADIRAVEGAPTLKPAITPVKKPVKKPAGGTQGGGN